MPSNGLRVSRRRLLATSLTCGALAVASGIPPALAALLNPTPRQTRGPFYPLTKPLDQDNDLTMVAGRSGQAQGTVIHLFGRVLGPSGRPVRGANVEIWQTNAFGRYHHPHDSRRDAPVDPGFQGYGRELTDDEGVYRFKTIEPAAYPASANWMRPPHIHFALSAPGFGQFVTQMYFAGNPLNQRDRLLNGVRNPAERARLIVDFRPAPALDAGALEGRFDIVLAPG